MKLTTFTLALAFAVTASAAETKPADPKPAAKPAAKPAPKKPASKKPAPKPGTAKPSPAKQPSIKDLALADARKSDANGNGKIEGSEVSALRGVFAQNPNSYLYIFDDNSNKMLDDAEIAKIEFAPKAKPAPPKPGAKPAPKKPAQPKKK